jgi:hypothetical protein
LIIQLTREYFGNLHNLIFVVSIWVMMYIKIAKKNRIIQILTQIDAWSVVSILSDGIISINSCVV